MKFQTGMTKTNFHACGLNGRLKKENVLLANTSTSLLAASEKDSKTSHHYSP